MGVVLPNWATTLLGAIIGIAVAWGTLRANVSALKDELCSLRQTMPRLLEELAGLKTTVASCAAEAERMRDRLYELSDEVAKLNALYELQGRRPSNHDR